MIISLGLMALAYIYMPSMVFGSSVLLMYVAMVAMSAGISNATVTPPLVIASAMGGKDYGRIFSLAVAFYYAGNAIGAPLWGALGNAGPYGWACTQPPPAGLFCHYQHARGLAWQSRIHEGRRS